MHRNVFRFARLLVLVATTLSLSGCWGPSRFDVTGQVKYNGEPLDKPGGEIVFVGPDGTQVGATLGPDGTYRAAGVPAGLNRVAVYYRNPSARVGKPSRQTKPREPSPKNQPSASLFLTPAKYASVDTSKLSVEVKKGTVYNVDLTGPAIP